MSLDMFPDAAVAHIVNHRTSRAFDDILDDVDRHDLMLSDEIDKALDELEEAIASVHRWLLWDAAADPETGRQTSRAARCGQRAMGVRKVAMLVERARIDGLG